MSRQLVILEIPHLNDFFPPIIFLVFVDSRYIPPACSIPFPTLFLFPSMLEDNFEVHDTSKSSFSIRRKSGTHAFGLADLEKLICWRTSCVEAEQFCPLAICCSMLVVVVVDVVFVVGRYSAQVASTPPNIGARKRNNLFWSHIGSVPHTNRMAVRPSILPSSKQTIHTSVARSVTHSDLQYVSAREQLFRPISSLDR